MSVPRKIIGIGRNYQAHAKELGNTVAENPKKMIIFLKPPTSFLAHSPSAAILLPKGADVHHEVELGVYIGRGGKNIAETDAMAHVSGYCLALDMTARNWQTELQKAGHPWARAKGCDTFCAVGDFIPKGDLSLPAGLWLSVDGEMRQKGTTADMIYPVEQLVAECSNAFTLEEGDLILSGTPSGVGAVRAGQKIRAGIDGHGEYEWNVANAKM